MTLMTNRNILNYTTYGSSIPGCTNFCTSYSTSASYVISQNNSDGGTCYSACSCNRETIDAYCTCVGVCGCNYNYETRCSCNTRYFCTCNGDINRTCDVHVKTKTSSDYTWNEDIRPGLNNTTIKREHIIELRNALISETNRRSYNISGGPLNLKDASQITSAILSQLDQSSILQYQTEILMTAWKNITTYINTLRNSNASCSTNTSDLTGISISLNTNITGGTALQTLIQAIDTIRSTIDNINKACVCNTKVIFPGCSVYKECTSNSETYQEYVPNMSNTLCNSNRVCNSHNPTVSNTCSSNCTCNKVCTYHCFSHTLPCVHTPVQPDPPPAGCSKIVCQCVGITPPCNCKAEVAPCIYYCGSQRS